MKNTQENKLSKYYTVQKVCSDNNGVWNGLPAFVSAFGDFGTNIGKIEGSLGTQEKNITGVSQSKDSIEDVMIEKTLQVSGAVFAYASDINDLTLKVKVDFSKSDLKQVRDSFTLQRCQLMYDEANTIIGSLGNYGITATDLSDLQNKINAYAALIASPRTAITEKKGATDEIGKLLVKADGILKNKLDKLMENFKTSSPDFYRLYFDARIIVELGSRNTSLKGKVKNVKDGSPVEKASVQLIFHSGKENEKIKNTETDKSGEFILENVFTGEHTLKTSKAGFETSEIEKLVVERGKVNEVSVNIKEAGSPS